MVNTFVYALNESYSDLSTSHAVHIWYVDRCKGRCRPSALARFARRDATSGRGRKQIYFGQMRLLQILDFSKLKVQKVKPQPSDFKLQSSGLQLCKSSALFGAGAR